MKNKTKISMNGKMAYIIMCVEKFLVAEYPEKNWEIISSKLWEATEIDWETWTESYCSYIPDVLLQYDSNDESETGLSSDIFSSLNSLYANITTGNEDSSDDLVNRILNIPLSFAMVYEGTEIGDGKEANQIITSTEKMLKNAGITLPDESQVYFSSSAELNGWGNRFDGKYLSIILK